jgi:hypothetical protein
MMRFSLGTVWFDQSVTRRNTSARRHIQRYFNSLCESFPWIYAKWITFYKVGTFKSRSQKEQLKIGWIHVRLHALYQAINTHGILTAHKDFNDFADHHGNKMDQTDAWDIDVNTGRKHHNAQSKHSGHHCKTITRTKKSSSQTIKTSRESKSYVCLALQDPSASSTEHK